MIYAEIICDKRGQLNEMILFKQINITQDAGHYGDMTRNDYYLLDF